MSPTVQADRSRKQSLGAWLLMVLFGSNAPAAPPPDMGFAAPVPISSGLPTPHPYLQFSNAISAATGPAGSTEVPLQQCTLQGSLPYMHNGTMVQQEVALHMWIRLVLHASTLHIKGFSWAQLPKRREDCFIYRNVGGFECAAPSIANYTGQIVIKSSRDRSRRFVVERTNRQLHDRLDGQIQPLFGKHKLAVDDAFFGELELHAFGFSKHCKVFAEFATPAQAELLELTPARAIALGEDAERERRAARPVRFVSSPIYLDKGEELLNIFQPFIQHMQIMGISHFTIYMLEAARALSLDPRAKAYMAEGVLDVIMWNSLPVHTYQQRHLRDTAGYQVLQYNHALLRLWLEDVWVLFADTDEYLVTRKPGLTLPQALAECKTPWPLVSLSIAAHNTHCEVCPFHDTTIGDHTGDRFVWNKEEFTKGKHPLLMYKMRNHSKGPHPKSISYPTWLTSYGIHSGHAESKHVNNTIHVLESGPVPYGTGNYGFQQIYEQAEGGERLRFMHLQSLFMLRHDSPARILDNPLSDDESWFWSFLPDRPLWARQDMSKRKRHKQKHTKALQ